MQTPTQHPSKQTRWWTVTYAAAGGAVYTRLTVAAYTRADVVLEGRAVLRAAFPKTYDPKNWALVGIERRAG